MALVTVENTREHEITLNVVPKGGELAQVTIPAARQSADDKNKIVNGSAQIDDALIAEARKDKVVAHYFDEGWLQIVKKPGKTANDAGAGNTGGAN